MLAVCLGPSLATAPRGAVARHPPSPADTAAGLLLRFQLAILQLTTRERPRQQLDSEYSPRESILALEVHY